MRRALLAALLAASALFDCAQAADVSTDPRQAPAGAYRMETRHTQVIFAILHFGITDYYGRFNKISGTLNFNPAAPEKSAVDISIDMSSVDVSSSPLIGELAGADVFDAAQFPAATFKSTAIERTGPTTGKMTGDLTIHGVTRPVTFDVTFNGGLSAPLGAAAYDLGFHATGTIKRSAFGLDKMRWTGFVGDEVKLTIEAMFMQQKS